MRKDVRTGAAIGGVLIVAIIIYFAVSKGHNSKKNPVVLDTGKNAPADTSSGGSDAVVASHEEHADPLAQLTHEPLTAGGGVVPAPAHGDDATATPAASDTDSTPTKSSKNWATLLTADYPVLTRTPEPRPVSDPIPGLTDRSAVAAADHSAADRSNISAGSVGADRPIVADRSTAGSLTDSPVPTGEGNHTPAPTRRSQSPAPADPAPATPPAPSADTPASKIHHVVTGETFSSIARLAYGDSKYYKLIIKANPKVDPERLKPGMTIVLPPKPQASTSSPAASSSAGPSAGGNTDSAPAPTRHRTVSASSTPATVNTSSEYRVQSSDNLYKISMKLYHSPNKVDAIYQLNKAAIGDDPAKLKLNMVLKLPEPPVQQGQTH